MKHRIPRLTVALLALAVAACAPLAGQSPDGRPLAGAVLHVAAGAEDSTALPSALRLSRVGAPGVDLLLLGETHDNPNQHRLRLRWLEELARTGPFVLAVEQLDTDHQAALDRAFDAGLSAKEVAEAGRFEFKAWGWSLYEPFFEFAVRHRIRLVAANLSRERATAISRGQPLPMADARPSDWSAADADALAAEIRLGHCGMLPERAVEPIARAQRARDATIASVIAKARADTGLPVVLLAGNGHVRLDRGVPRYLRDVAPGVRVLSVGLLEEPVGRVDPAGYDLVVGTAAQPREDPCEGMRQHMRKSDLGDRK
jgi:uncharacterized iron-regulated protein